MSNRVATRSAGAVAALLCALAALADPVRTDPTPDITVFTDGDQVVTLVAGTEFLGTPPIRRVINAREDGKARVRRAFGGQRSAYAVRMRFIGGRLVCEKFAERPRGDEAIAARAAELFMESCS